MTGTEAEPVIPHGKAFYSVLAFFAVLAGLAFTFSIFTGGAPLGWRLVRAVVAAGFLGGALQALERLFRPEKAYARSRSLDSTTRAMLRVARKALVGLCVSGFAVGAMIRLTGGAQAAELATDLQILVSVLFFLAYCIADVCGERFFSLLPTGG